MTRGIISSLYVNYVWFIMSKGDRPRQTVRTFNFEINKYTFTIDRPLADLSFKSLFSADLYMDLRLVGGPKVWLQYFLGLNMQWYLLSIYVFSLFWLLILCLFLHFLLLLIFLIIFSISCLICLLIIAFICGFLWFSFSSSCVSSDSVFISVLSLSSDVLFPDSEFIPTYSEAEMAVGLFYLFLCLFLFSQFNWFSLLSHFL